MDRYAPAEFAQTNGRSAGHATSALGRPPNKYLRFTGASSERLGLSEEVGYGVIPLMNESTRNACQANSSTPGFLLRKGNFTDLSPFYAIWQGYVFALM